MIVFWLIAGGLLVAALLFVLPPLLTRGSRTPPLDRARANAMIYQDQMRELENDLRHDLMRNEHYQEGRDELQKRLIEDVAVSDIPPPPESGRATQVGRVTAVLVGLFVPLLAIGLYFTWGAPSGLDPDVTPPPVAAGQEHNLQPNQVLQMVERLQQKLKENPDNVQGWAILARSLYALNRMDDALIAFGEATSRGGADAALLVDYADALAMVSPDKTLEGAPWELIEKALTLDPNNDKGLWLAGTREFERKNYAGALEYWTKLRNHSTDPQVVAEMDNVIAEAEQKLGRAPGTTVAAAPPRAPTARALAQVSGTIHLSRELLAQAAPDDAVFIFARPVNGPRMPLAVQRAQVKDLPLEFTLDESMAPQPTATLATVAEVIVGARISKRGNAAPQAGDLEGLSTPVRVGARDVKIEINSAVQ